MTEKEKQQAGELYNADDRELVNERIKAKKLCSEYNAVECNDFQKRERILDRLLAMKGKKTVIEPNFFCDYGYNILLGDNFYSNHNLVILDCAQVVFGDNIFIGPNCGFYTAEHPVDAALRNQGLEYAKPITVGDNVWIGGGVNDRSRQRCYKGYTLKLCGSRKSLPCYQDTGAPSRGTCQGSRGEKGGNSRKQRYAWQYQTCRASSQKTH